MMKTNRQFVASLFLLLLISLPALAQYNSGGVESKRFAGGGVALDYPGAWTLSDKSDTNNQHLVLEMKGTAAQIMVFIERTPSTRPGQRTEALRARNDKFAEIMTTELEKLGGPVQRTEVATEVSGMQVEGLKLRSSPGGQPSSVEVYSLLMDGRIVMLTYLRPDRDATVGNLAWAQVRRSLRVGPNTDTTSRSTPLDTTGLITAPSTPRPAKFAGLDYGTVNGWSYTNNFFGMRLTIPYGWRVQGQEVKDLINQKGREGIQTNDPRRNAQIDASVSNTVNLLTVLKYEVGAAAEFNASLMCGAEWLPNLSITSSQYMTSTRNTLQASQGKYYFKPVTTETVGGESFSVMEVSTANDIKQRYYITVKKGYALFIIITYVTEEDEAILKQSLRSVRFS